MSSSSSVTASGSRSSSPHTPEPSDSLEHISVHNTDIDLSASWFLAPHHPKPQVSWDVDPSLFLPTGKSEESEMLHLDELIEQHAYDDSPSPLFSPTVAYQRQHHVSHSHQSPLGSDRTIHPTTGDTSVNPFPPSNLGPPQPGNRSLTKPIPPPASLPRKHSMMAANQRVVHPPKESCFNLPIMFPSIPEGGTKSRVETQVRVTVDLADSSSSSDPYKYDRVGSWKWLKLPQGTATKKRTRKQGKIDPDPQDILHLSVSITCASPPYNRVLSCSSCQAREAKRVAKKLAARVRPARSDSESGEDANRTSKSKHHEDTTSIIQFNCAEVLDFSSGSAVLPLRITCYCRHHREKVGFNVHFTMMDHNGRIIGTGSSRPIMITDDHKTAVGSSNSRPTEPTSPFPNMDSDWAQVGTMLGQITSTDIRAPSKRKKDVATVTGKKRPKPYDAAGKLRASRQGSVSSAASPSVSQATLPATRSPTPPTAAQQFLTPEMNSQSQPLLSTQSSETSSPDTLATPLDQSIDVLMPEATYPTELSIPVNSALLMPAHPHAMPYLFFDSMHTSQSLQMQIPTIHRLIPNMGPTHGGTEVTVLGTNFHPSIQLTCVFGDVPATSTQRWSDNTLVCILPPRAMPGVVAVWFEGFQKSDDQTSPTLFTYSDESDRALMELALQVVGLKMTGKIEDAKNVAMRIVGTAGSDNDSQGANHNSNMMQVSSSTAADLRSRLLVRSGEGEDFEGTIIKCLTVLDTPLADVSSTALSTAQAISHPSVSGQTLLHLASLLGFATLTKFLVDHDVDIDARDRNGYTALHFTALSASSECAKILVAAGADKDVVNALGKTPQEIAPKDFFRGMFSGDVIYDSDANDSSAEDEEADWGDAEEDGDVPSRRTPAKRTSRRALRRVGSFPRTPQDHRSKVNSRAPSPRPVPLPPAVDFQKGHSQPNAGMDAKQTASFMEMIQRTLAQLPAPQGILPNMPQLPLPHLPNLPELGMPAVPWASLPQIPMVFPVFVPMPAWPSFFGGEHQNGEGGADANKTQDDGASRRLAAGPMKAAQEWRATWEKWVALAVATAARQRTEEPPPPMYTPRAESTDALAATATPLVPQEAPLAPTSNVVASESRPIGYGLTPVTDQEVNAFAYQPPSKKNAKKQDRMLLLFWLPILLISLLWACHHSFQFVYQVLKKGTLPGRALRN